MGQWQKVFSSDTVYKAEIVKSVLEEHGIAAVVINKQDSSYRNFGYCEVHVLPEEVMEAVQIIKNEITFK